MKTLLRLISAVVLVAPLALSQGVAPAMSPSEIVRRAVEHEIQSSQQSHQPFLFKDERKTRHLDQIKLMVETREATAGLLLAENGRPLTPAERQAEEARLERYIHNPEELARKRKQEKEDAERTERIMNALPDAFLYEPDGTQPSAGGLGHAGDELTRLKFRPNPNYSPPSHVEQVLTGMQGSLLIDEKEHQIAQMDGVLQKEVGFGWGVFGHLDRGGHFLVEQADVGGDQWEVTRMELAFTGRILFFKKISIQSSDTFSDFRPVSSSLTFAEGVELLKKEAQNLLSRSLPRAKAVESTAQPSEQTSSRRKRIWVVSASRTRAFELSRFSPSAYQSALFSVGSRCRDSG